MKNKSFNLAKPITAAMLIALAITLPFLTGQIQQIGNMLCPMHIPVLICGFICGPYYGLLVGGISPLLRSVCFGMPNIFPEAVGMSAELMAYGFFSGFIYRLLPKRKLSIYISLVLSMLIGRVVWGCVRALLYGVFGAKFSLAIFIAGAFTKAIPGIILQLILIPVLVLTLERIFPKLK